MCKALGKTYLVFVNAITLILGLGIVGVSTYSLVKYSDIDAVLSKTATWAVLAAGALVFLLSILGCCAAKRQNRCGLFVYIVLVLGLVVAQLIAGGVMANYAGELKLNDNPKLNNTLSDLSTDVREFVECSYFLCCDAPKDPNAQCNQNVWNSDGFCKVLPNDLKGNSAACVSATSADYNQTIVDWLHDHVRQLSIAAIVVGCVQLLAVMFATCLLCSKKPKSAEELEAERRLNENRQAGTLTYGSAPPPATNANTISYAV